LGRDTTTVSAWYGSSPGCANDAEEPSMLDFAQPPFAPERPAKHATLRIWPGAVTDTRARSMGTSQSAPIAFQNSSSWSGKPFRAPSTRYTIA
jgi:hypothetical protein